MFKHVRHLSNLIFAFSFLTDNYLLLDSNITKYDSATTQLISPVYWINFSNPSCQVCTAIISLSP